MNFSFFVSDSLMRMCLMFLLLEVVSFFGLLDVFGVV